jgi:hypothetical protein
MIGIGRKLLPGGAKCRKRLLADNEHMPLLDYVVTRDSKNTLIIPTREYLPFYRYRTKHPLVAMTPARGGRRWHRPVRV